MNPTEPTAHRPWKRKAGRLAATLALLALAALVVVSAKGRSDLVAAGSANGWPAIDPRVALATGMADISRATREGREPPVELVHEVVELSRALPMRSEPFLVAGIEASAQGDADRAERLLLAAKARDPRSVPVRYFLAEHFHRQGDDRRSIEEVVSLLRLRSSGDFALAPYFVRLASEPASRGAVNALMNSDPALGRQVLAIMAASESDPELVLALWKNLKPDLADRAWQENLLARLVSKGKVERAHSIWRTFAGRAGATAALYNPSFANDPAPAPFNWRYRSSADGVAEPDGSGGLSLLFYGRSSMVLAEQMLALSPGRYRLSWAASTESESIVWRAQCLQGASPLAQAKLAAKGMDFAIAGDCPFIWLELAGMGPNDNGTSAVTVSALQLEKQP